MAMTPINSEDRLVQATFAKHLERVLGWDSVYAWNQETFGSDGTLGRADTKQAVLTRDLRASAGTAQPRPAGLRHRGTQSGTSPCTTSAARWCSTTAISIGCSAVAYPWNTGTPRGTQNPPAPG